MIISNNPIIHQASFCNTHQQLKSDFRPKEAEKNTGCFRDMLQRVKNIELNKLNSVNKSQEIWKSLKIDKIRTSYTRMAEQLFSFQSIENTNLNSLRGSSFYNEIVSKPFSNQLENKFNYISINEIKVLIL